MVADTLSDSVLAFLDRLVVKTSKPYAPRERVPSSSDRKKNVYQVYVADFSLIYPKETCASIPLSLSV